MDYKYRVSVVIVNYNAGELLPRCVAAVFDAGQDLEVIVVDNASTDNSLELLVATFPEQKSLHIKPNRSNLGFARASNIGTETASGKYLLYLNPDTRVEPNSIALLVDALDNNEDSGMVGGLIMNPDGSEQRGCRRSIPTPWRAFVGTFIFFNFNKLAPGLFSDFIAHQGPLPDRPAEVEAISGACMMLRREAIATVGLLDEEYFLHCEDLDWCMRFRQKGWKILFVPDARLTHFQGTCSHSKPVFVEWQKHKGMVRFYRKFFRRRYPALMMGLIIVGVWARFSMILCHHCIGMVFHRAKIIR